MRRICTLALLALALAIGTASAAVIEYSDLAQARPTDGSVRLLSVGEKFSSFERKAPAVLDPQFLQEFGAQGYLRVDFKAIGNNTFEGSSSQYVASITNASVCGSEGDVWDDKGRLYRANTWVRHPASKLQAWKEEAEARGIRHFKRLASAVHRVSFMYFHFMTEALPKIAKFAPFLAADPDLKLLTYGTEFELAWIQKLGIRKSQLVTFDPLFAYTADELLVSNPVDIARTPKEDLQKLLSVAGLPAPLPESERIDLVYVSRRRAAERLQTNEEALLAGLELEAAAQGLNLVVHDGNPALSVQDNIEIFRRAKVVMGPNGAGLAHLLFAAPGTPLVELMFINNTGMDLWHLTAALGQSYYMVPLPRSYWLDPGSEVPLEQALSTLRWALAAEAGAPPACPPGSAPAASGSGCAACPAGTFSTGYDKQCMACSPGWVAERTGSGFCHICLSSSFAAGPAACAACPAGTLAAMPGSTAAEECLGAEDLAKVKAGWLPEDRVVAKVSATYRALSQRRRVQQAARGALQLTDLQLTDLPAPLRERVLSEVDACSGGSEYAQYSSYYSSYGCGTTPPAASSPPPVQSQSPSATPPPPPAPAPGTTAILQSGDGGKKVNKGAIAGGVVGGVAGVALLGAVAYIGVRRKKAHVAQRNEV